MGPFLRITYVNIGYELHIVKAWQNIYCGKIYLNDNSKRFI